MHHFGQIIAEVIFGFFGLFLLTKFVGKTQMNQITAFDFIAAIAVGELFGNALFDEDAGIPEIATAIVTWGLLMLVIEKITQLRKGTRRFLEGSPSIVIHQGKIRYEVMKKNKLDFNQLMHELRAKDAFSIQEVDYAILESNGSLSVLKKSANQNPTRQDLKLPPLPNPLTISFILDGEILYDNLKESGKDDTWLKRELEKQKIHTARDVVYAEWTENNGLYALKY